MRLLVVGQNPSTKTVNNQTLSRLADWMSQAGVLHWSFVNVSSDPRKIEPTREDREFLWGCIICSDTVCIIALGSKAAWILKQLNVSYLKLPHPSGLNRQLNDPFVEMQAINSLINANKAV